MKYHVKCPGCGNEGDLELDFEPRCCLRCGCSVEVMEVKKRPRIRAEEIMHELDDLIPRLKDAYDAYMAVSVEWYDRRDRLQYYAKRGIVTPEEVERYTRRVGMDKSEKSYNQRLKEHREDRKRGSNVGN